MGVCNYSMFCCTLLYVHSSIAIILTGKRELVPLLNLSSWCLVMVEWLFLVVPWGCLRFVIVVFPDHTHLLFLNKIESWATSNGFKCSKSKTQSVHFCQLHKQHDDPVLHSYGSPIPVVEESKFLGMIFDKKLSFIPILNISKLNVYNIKSFKSAFPYFFWAKIKLHFSNFIGL